MLKKIKKLLAGDPVEGIAAIDIAALEAALDDAQRKRAGLILDGTVDEILAAERAVATARIELERGRLALAELERRKAEADARAAREALERRRAEAQAKVDAAVARIEKEYPGHAAAIAALAELAREADEAAHRWLEVVVEGRAEDLPAVDPVAERLGWHDEFVLPPAFAEGPSLPPVGSFNGYGEAGGWMTHVHRYAISGHVQPGAHADRQMTHGTRWKAAA